IPFFINILTIELFILSLHDALPISASYPAESRVVWRKNVYVSQWWNSAVQPDDPGLGAADNPWQLIGPVLPGESPLPVLALPGRSEERRRGKDRGCGWTRYA